IARNRFGDLLPLDLSDRITQGLFFPGDVKGGDDHLVEQTGVLLQSNVLERTCRSIYLGGLKSHKGDFENDPFFGGNQAELSIKVGNDPIDRALFDDGRPGEWGTSLVGYHAFYGTLL